VVRKVAAATTTGTVTEPQALAGQFSPMLGLVERLLAQHRTSKNKLYSLHAP
jgi:IS5 family transposase